MNFGFGGGWRSRLDAAGCRRSFAIRSAFERFTQAKLQWEIVAGGRDLVADPEPMVEYQGRFPDFCREILGVTPWSKQDEIGEAVETHNKVSVSACYASGKTFIAACLVLYWLFTRRPAFCVTSAPTTRQVKGLLWREVRKLYKRCARALKGRMLQAKLEFADDWQGFGFSTSGDNQASGYHEDNLLFIIDEAAGVSQESFDDFDGITATAGAKMLLIGNPICSAGPFFDSHKDPIISETYVRITISALDTPNYLARRTVIRGLCEYEWVEERRKRWGTSSPMWKVRVLGEFVQVSGEQVVPTAFVVAAQARWEELGGREAAAGRKILGIDVAGGGRDETVVYLRHGRFLWRVGATSEGNHDTLYDWIVELATQLEVDSIYIDATMISKGLADRLAASCGYDEDEQPLDLPKCNVVRIWSNVGPDDPDCFADRATEICFAARRALDPENPEALAVDPTDAELLKELPARHWWFDPKNRIKAENKTQLRKRKIKSPDYGDAATLTTLQRELVAA